MRAHTLFRIFTTIALTLGVAQASPSFSVQDLADEIHGRAERVTEFAEIRKMAEKRGLKVWLFGGTAAAYAHYVKWDLLRERGDARFQAERFDYDFTNIFRSNQDLDLVVDGTPEKVQEFQNVLQERFAYFLGNKDRWEVRSLRHPNGEKMALLGDPNFHNQHTDSHSTGLIALHAEAERPVRDLRDWHSRTPSFLQDVWDGKLHYYFSDQHETTSRFQRGLNPPIISVVRYFTKAFQFELEVRPEDVSRLRKIILEFEPKALGSGYVRSWLEKNGPKLFQNAVDVAFAKNMLVEVGLLEKLVSISNASKEGSLGWWMNKEPLRDGTDPMRLRMRGGEGKTAKALKISVVTHETRDFQAYESIRRSHRGIPNVFISRQKAAGESAAFGDGFYTQIGKKGAAGTGFHIRMRVAPDAREGVDFLRVSKEYVLWLTRDKLQVIPESLNMTLTEAVHFLLDPKNRDENGIREMAKRKLRCTVGCANEAAELERYLDGVIRSELQARQTSKPKLLAIILNDILSQSVFFEMLPKWPEWLSLLVEREKFHDSLVHILGKPEVVNHPEWPNWMDAVVKRISASRSRIDAHARLLLNKVLLQPEVRGHERWSYWVDVLRKRNSKVVIETLSSDPSIASAKHFEQWVDELIGAKKTREMLIKTNFFQQRHVLEHPRWRSWMELLISKGEWNTVLKSIGVSTNWDLDQIRTWLKKSHSQRGVSATLLEEVLSRPQALMLPEFGAWIDEVVHKGELHQRAALLRFVLSQPHVIQFLEWEQWMSTLISSPSIRDPYLEDPAAVALVRKEAMRRSKKWTTWIERVTGDRYGALWLARHFVHHPVVMDRSDWKGYLAKVVGDKEARETFVEEISLYQRETEWFSHPKAVELLESLIRAIPKKETERHQAVFSEVLEHPDAMAHPRWFEWFKMLDLKTLHYAGELEALLDNRALMVRSDFAEIQAYIVRAVASGNLSSHAGDFLALSRSVQHPEWPRMMDLLIDRGRFDMVSEVLEQPAPQEHPEWFLVVRRAILKALKSRKSDAVDVLIILNLASEKAMNHPEWHGFVRDLISMKGTKKNVAAKLLSEIFADRFVEFRPEWSDLMKLYIEKHPQLRPEVLRLLRRSVDLELPEWKQYLKTKKCEKYLK